MADQTTAPVPFKKTGHRSPNYPAFDLATALEKVKLVYDKDRRTATTLQVIAGHLGYKHTDGPGGRALSCLRQYGLLEEAAGLLKVSESAYKLLHLPDEDAEKPVLLKQAALKPNLYRSLHDAFPDGIPSDATLKSNLINRGYNPDSLTALIADFRATMELAKVYDVLDDGAEDESKMQTNPIAPSPKPSEKTPPQTLPAGFEATGNRIFAMAFEGDGQAALTLKGTYTPEDLDDLEAYIATSLKTLRRSIAKKESVQ